MNSQDIIVLEGYIEDLGLNKDKLTKEDLILLRSTLIDGDEIELAEWIDTLSNPQELLEYI